MQSLRRAILAAFVVVQGLLPMWAIVDSGPARRTDFTWDMFAVRRECDPCELQYRVGEGEWQRISWGLRAPRLQLVGEPEPALELFAAPALEPSSVARLERFDGQGRGALHTAGTLPAVNVRAAPQVARLKTTTRLRRLGRELCAELGALYEEVEAGGDGPRWAARDARRWHAAGRRLEVRAVCECAHNARPAIEVIDPEEDLCGG